jgi:hypothetical protein
MMPANYVDLPISDQSDILRQAAMQLGKRAIVLEKDIWICWALRALFAMPNPYSMAFGGGTSLSKVYGVIDRFSEDIDITLDYRALNSDIENAVNSSGDITKSQIKKYKSELRESVKRYASHTIIPHLEQERSKLSTAHQHEIYINESKHDTPGQKISVVVNYRSVIQKSGLGFGSGRGNFGHSNFADPTQDYLKSRILIELVGYNVTEPSSQYDVLPDIASTVPDISFPVSKVMAFSIAGTFWQKITLIHEKCRRKKIEPRLARHWYDVAMLAKHPKGKSAINDRHLLKKVVDIKRIFYRYPDFDYAECLLGQCRLVPDKKAFDALQKDYEHMVAAGMMNQNPLTFSEIINAMQAIEEAVNANVD